MAQGHLYINGKDAFIEYGIILANNSLSALMTPAPLKEWISNEVRSEDGTRYLVSDAPKQAKRDVSIIFQLVAQTEEQFARRYQKFCDEVLSLGIINLRTKWQPTIEYHFVYESCSQFNQFLLGIATFGLKMVEPNPTDRTIRSTYYSQQ